MYNLNDNSSGYGAAHGGAAYGGGASMGFSMPVAPAAVGGYGAAPIFLGGGNGGMFGGGDGCGILGLLAILAIAGRGNGGLFGGGNDGGGCAVPTLLSDNINGRFGSISDQIAAGAAASVAATHQAASIEATRDNGAAICGLRQEVATVGGIINTNLQAGFGAVALESCRDTGLIVSAINSNANDINRNVTQVGTQGLISDMNTQRQLADCCCTIERELLQNRYLNAQQTCEINQNTNMGIQRILDKMCDNELKGAYAKIQELQLEKSQSLQNQYLTNLINPPVQNCVPVSGSQPLFRSVISADSLCGYGDSSFRRGNYGGGNCGSGCSGF